MNMKLENLSHNGLLQFIETYNNDIQELDYVDSGTPVSVYEFFEYEYQEILEQNKN